MRFKYYVPVAAIEASLNYHVVSRVQSRAQNLSNIITCSCSMHRGFRGFIQIRMFQAFLKYDVCVPHNMDSPELAPVT